MIELVLVVFLIVGSIKAIVGAIELLDPVWGYGYAFKEIGIGLGILVLVAIAIDLLKGLQ